MIDLVSSTSGARSLLTLENLS